MADDDGRPVAVTPDPAETPGPAETPEPAETPGPAETSEPADGQDAVDVIMAQWQRELPGVDPSGLAVFGRLHRSYLLYAARLGEVFDRYGINMASFDVLAALRRGGPPYRQTAGRLATTGLITTGGVTLRLDRLESAGLVTRERDASDRRVVYAQLTAAGLDVAGEVATAVLASQQHMLAGVTETERAQLAVLLTAVERSLRAQP
jgi:DNA-binding MarR family transcriptional regulator